MSEDEDALWQSCAGLWAKPDPWDKPVVHLGEKLDTMSPDAKPYRALAPYCKVEPSGNCSVSTERIADDSEIWRDIAGSDAPVPDAPSEIAVTEEMVNAAVKAAIELGPSKSLAWAEILPSIYRAMRALEPPFNQHQLAEFITPIADAERDARRQRNEMQAERDAERARAEAAELDLARTNENYRACVRINLERIAERDAFEQQLSHVEDQLLESRAQIVRLMAERDEARNLLNVATDRLTKFIAAEPKPQPELKHNPFRVIEKDRRMMGP